MMKMYMTYHGLTKKMYFKHETLWSDPDWKYLKFTSTVFSSIDARFSGVVKELCDRQETRVSS